MRTTTTIASFPFHRIDILIMYAQVFTLYIFFAFIAHEIVGIWFISRVPVFIGQCVFVFVGAHV